MCLHPAGGPRTAGPRTRVPALVFFAGQGAGAVLVVLTLPLPAEHVGVSLVAGGTPTVCSTSPRQALGVGPAGTVVPAGVDPLTALDGVWHGAVALQALTHRVALTVDFTQGVWAARGGEAGVRRWGARLNPGTPGDCVWHGAVAIETGAHRVPLPVLLALCVGPAGGRTAGVWPGPALVGGADHAAPAVRVSLALSATAGDGVRLGDVGGEAAAHGVPDTVHHTLCVGPAGAWITRVWPLYTPLALADIASLAVRVPDTLRSTPRDGVWLGDQPCLAPADGVSTKVHSAHSSRTAGAWVAGVWLLHTPLVLTDIPLLTVGICDTLRPAACDGVRLRDEAR